MADRIGFAPASPSELLEWTGPDAGPPAAAVTPDPTRDRPGVLSAVAASTLAGRLVGPAAATAAWTPTSPTTATALIGGRRLVVVDESDPHGWFTSLSLYEVSACGVCGGEHQIPIQPAGPGSPALAGPTRPSPEPAAAPAHPRAGGRMPATSPSRKEAGYPCRAAG